eukprot:SAG31_NODE_410_length_15989_cov_237.233984_6_plen_58_part_00
MLQDVAATADLLVTRCIIDHDSGDMWTQQGDFSQQPHRRRVGHNTVDDERFVNMTAG